MKIFRLAATFLGIVFTFSVCLCITCGMIIKKRQSLKLFNKDEVVVEVPEAAPAAA